MSYLKKCILGEIVTYTFVIEYEKRGLPILTILKSKYKNVLPQ